MTPVPSSKLLIALCKIYDYWLNDRKWKITGFCKTRLLFLITHPTNADSTETFLISKLESVATAEEWVGLDSIVNNNDRQINQLVEVLTYLDSYLQIDDLIAAQEYISNFSSQIVREIYEEKLGSYIRKEVMLIEQSVNRNSFLSATKILKNIHQFLPKEKNDELTNLIHKKENEYIEGIVEVIQQACKTYNFSLAYEKYKLISYSYPKENFDKLIVEAKQEQKKERIIKAAKEKIVDLLIQYEFSSAINLYGSIKEFFPIDEFQSLMAVYKNKKEKENKIIYFEELLSSHQFHQADSEFLSTDLLNYNEYINIKAHAVQSVMNRNYSSRLSLEQAIAISQIGSNVLIKARAGSGKTRTIVTKAALLLDFHGVEPDKLILLAFNRKAAQEINYRMRESFNRSSFKNASTFHSLAYKIVNKKLDLLTDPSEKSTEITQIQFFQNVLRNVLQNNEHMPNAFQFLRTEIEELKKYGLLLNKEEYYFFKRGLPQISLRGETVFSKLEKIIADYLFEYAIDYQYSKGFKLSHCHFHPSFFFTANDQMLIIETWEHFDSRLDSRESISRDEVRKKLKSLCEDDSIVLLELTDEETKDLSRLQIEEILTQLLRENDVVLIKLPIEVVYQKVFDNPKVKTRLSNLCGQFIKRAKKLSLSPEDLRLKASTYSPVDEREFEFLELVQLVYKKYEEEKKAAGKIDFDDLLLMAINKVKDLKEKCVIEVDKLSIHLSQLQWIFIDEFQDFSDLFFQLVSEIKNINNDVNLFCVGDDWQAINGFAGSDLKFFNDFISQNHNSKLLELVTNHRNQAKIVQLGNQLMSGYGTGGEPLIENQSGYVKLYAIDDIQLDIKNTEISPESYFYFYNQDKECQISISKYLKLAHDIVIAPEFIGKKIAILSRTDAIYGISNLVFIKKLHEWLRSSEIIDIQNQTNFVGISTIHSYKGREADVVILLEVTDSKFPLIHPDNYLLNILGRSINDSLDEERRLLYVGITRAKSALFLLTEKRRVSPFIERDLKLSFDDPITQFPYLKIPKYQEEQDDEIPF